MLIKNNDDLCWITHHSLHGRIRGTKNVSPTNSNTEEEVQRSWGDLDFIYAEYQVTEYCQWTGPVVVIYKVAGFTTLHVRHLSQRATGQWQMAGGSAPNGMSRKQRFSKKRLVWPVSFWFEFWVLNSGLYKI